MKVAYKDEELETFLENATTVSPDHPVVISKFYTNAKEIEIDAVANNGEIIIYAISEHIENAGVHSGDATMVHPPQRTYLETVKRIKRIARQFAEKLNITGPFNIQFLAKENNIKVIELNLRASRSFPFVSKIFKHNFIELATKAMLGEEIPHIDKSNLELDYVGVKAPQFSFSRLRGADPLPSVEMNSTGEVACFGDDLHEALLKSVISTGLEFPKKSILLSISGDDNKFKLLDHIQKLKDMNFEIFATEHTAEFYSREGVSCKKLFKIHEEGKKPNVRDYLLNKRVDLIISIPREHTKEIYGDTYEVRRAAVDMNIPLINNIQLASIFIDAISDTKLDELEVKSWGEYE